MSRQDSDHLTMAAGRQDSSCKVPAAPHMGWAAPSKTLSATGSRSEKSAEARNCGSGATQAVLPGADASAEAHEKREAGQAQETPGQVGFMLPNPCQQQHVSAWSLAEPGRHRRAVPSAPI